MMNEQQLEDLCITWFQETGWQFVRGPDIAPDGMRPERADYRQVILRGRLLAALARINPHIPAAALEQAVHTLRSISEPQAVLRNRSFHRLLLSGVSVEFSDGEEKKTDLVQLIDFANPRTNEFLVINQSTVAGTKQPRRPDLVAFVNGLPLAVIELKNPANVQTDVWDAFNLENSVGRARVCFFRLVRRGVTTRHSHSLQGGNNEAGRVEKGAIGCVAPSPIR